MLVVGFLFLRPRPQRILVTVAYDTNVSPAHYAVQVANLSRRPYVFSAWTEYRLTNGWHPVTFSRHGTTLSPTATDTFTLPKPESGKARIAVVYGAARSDLEDWIDSLRVFVGVHRKSDRMNIDAP